MRGFSGRVQERRGESFGVRYVDSLPFPNPLWDLRVPKGTYKWKPKC